MPPAWRIYYADGSTFSSDEGAWLDVPSPVGFEGVVHPDPANGRAIEHLKPMYFFPSWADHPWGCDEWGAMDLLLQLGVATPDQSPNDIPLRVLFDHGIYLGRSISTEEFNVIYERMKTDSDFLPMSAEERRVRRPA